jgi:hypothetical protein
MGDFGAYVTCYPRHRSRGSSPWLRWPAFRDHLLVRSMFSHRLTALHFGLVVIAASLIFAMPASAASGTAAIADCNSHNQLTQSYSIAELQNALATMPADVSEYTNCKDVINRELLIQEGKIKGTAPGSVSGSDSSGSSFLPTPVIIVLVVLLLAAATFGALALRRRRQPPS